MRMILPTFEDILVELEKKEMKGIGPLTRYDTATQLAFPGNKFPKKVHLCAGAAKGARALEVMGPVVDKQVFVNICPDFAKMSTAQIEDFLCVYKSYLKGEIEDELEFHNWKEVVNVNVGDRFTSHTAVIEKSPLYKVTYELMTQVFDFLAHISKNIALYLSKMSFTV